MKSLTLMLGLFLLFSGISFADVSLTGCSALASNTKYTVQSDFSSVIASGGTSGNPNSCFSVSNGFNITLDLNKTNINLSQASGQSVLLKVSSQSGGVEALNGGNINLTNVGILFGEDATRISFLNMTSVKTNVNSYPVLDFSNAFIIRNAEFENVNFVLSGSNADFLTGGSSVQVAFKNITLNCQSGCSRLFFLQGYDEITAEKFALSGTSANVLFALGNVAEVYFMDTSLDPLASTFNSYRVTVFTQESATLTVRDQDNKPINATMSIRNSQVTGDCTKLLCNPTASVDLPSGTDGVVRTYLTKNITHFDLNAGSLLTTTKITTPYVATAKSRDRAETKNLLFSSPIVESFTIDFPPAEDITITNDTRTLPEKATGTVSGLIPFLITLGAMLLPILALL